MAGKKRSGTSVDVEVGKRVRAMRIKKGMSQTALADKLGVSFQQIQKYEKGVNRIAPQRLETIAVALGHPVSVFFPSMDRANGVVPETFDAAPHDRQEMRLLENFGRIGDAAIKKAVVHLIQGIADLTPQPRWRG